MEYKALKGIPKLERKVAIYIADSVNIGDTSYKKYEVEQSQADDVAEACKLLTSLFGGASVETVRGYFEHMDGRVEREYTDKVYAFAYDITDEHIESIKYFMDVILERDNQECVGLEIDGVFYLYDGEVEHSEKLA